MGRRIRHWEPYTIYESTVRCVDRQFLSKPTIESRNIIGAAIARALLRFPVRVHWADANTNHLVIGFSATPEQIPNISRFLQLVNSLVARFTNRLLDREGPMWASRSRVIPVVDDLKAEERLLYSATNVSKDGLVERASQWEGFSTYNALAHGKKLVFSYVDWSAWRRDAGPFRKVPPLKYRKNIELTLEPLPSLSGMKPHARETRFRRLVREMEDAFARDRKARGVGVVGVTRLRAIDPRSRPVDPAPCSPMPLVHSSSAELRCAYLERYRSFVAAYRAASAAYRSGDLFAEFPERSFRPPLISPYWASAP
jgi:hypothetical protein